MSKTQSPVKQIKDKNVLDLENYCTYYFVAIANRVTRGASAQYLEKFGIGVVEWRCMVMLALEDGVSAARITETSGVNKSLVSRALSKLENAGYVEDFHGSTSKKPRLLQLTNQGRKLYDEVLKVALQRENALRKGLSDNEIKELLRMLRILLANSARLGEAEA